MRLSESTYDVPSIVPLAMIGTHKNVRQDWRRIIKKAVRSGTWAVVLNDLQFVALSEIDMPILLIGNTHMLLAAEVCIRPYIVIPQLFDTTFENSASRDLFYSCFRDLVIGGLDHFWFALAFLGSQRALPEKTSFHTVRASDTRRIMLKVLKWWPLLCRLQDRFSSDIISLPWPHWAMGLLGMWYDAGLEKQLYFRLISVKPIVAGEMLRQSLEELESL